jgi:hypothetical protein
MTGPFGLSNFLLTEEEMANYTQPPLEATGTLPPDFFEGDVRFICFSYPQMRAELFAFADDAPRRPTAAASGAARKCGRGVVVPSSQRGG